MARAMAYDRARFLSRVFGAARERHEEHLCTEKDRERHEESLCNELHRL